MDSRLLNFVVLGDARSGTSVVQSSLNNRRGAVCHADLFHVLPKVRQAAHENYFGPCADPVNSPEWFIDGITNPVQYITRQVFDNPRNGENSIGLRLFYDVVRRWELFELFDARCREGDFCMVHVVRNPVACFVSNEQAKRTNLFVQDSSIRTLNSFPVAVTIEVADLVAFCQENVANRHKLKAACDDCLEINYYDLFVDYQRTMHKVFDFLELPYSEAAAIPGCRRLRNWPMTGRIANLRQLRAEAPAYIRELLDAEDFF